MSVLYSNIKRLADAHKISLAELERNLKFSNGIISTWKKGNPSIDKIEKVANYFDVSTDYLLGRDSSLNTDDQNVLAMFRKTTEGMSESEKQDFQDSLGDLMTLAKKLVKDRKEHN